MRTRLVLLLVFVTIFAVALAGCEPAVTEPTPVPPAEEPGVAPDVTPDETPDPDEIRVIEVDAEDFEFSPNEIDVEVGETVQFVLNSIDDTHTFTVTPSIGDPEVLFSIEVPAGGTEQVTWTFDQEGEYYFFCEFHEDEGMWGTITVSE